MQSNNHVSITDLRYLSDETISGRNQIRMILSEGYHVPHEVIDWIFDRLDEREFCVYQHKLNLSPYEEELIQ